MFDFAKGLQNVHNDNRVKIGSKYNSKYNMVMRENLCDSTTTLGILDIDCLEFISGTTKEGLHPVIIQFIETIRQMLFHYIDASICSTSQMCLALMETDELSNLESISFDYMENSFDYLKTQLEEDFASKYKNDGLRRLVMFISFIVFLLFIFVAVWIPFVNNMNRDV